MRLANLPERSGSTMKARRDADLVFENTRVNFEAIGVKRAASRLDAQAHQWTRRRFFVRVRSEQENASVVLTQQTLKTALPVDRRAGRQRIAEVDDRQAERAGTRKPLGSANQRERTCMTRHLNRDERIEIDPRRIEVGRKQRAVFGLHPGDELSARLRLDHTGHRRRRPRTCMPPRHLDQPRPRQELRERQSLRSRPTSRSMTVPKDMGPPNILNKQPVTRGTLSPLPTH